MEQIKKIKTPPHWANRLYSFQCRGFYLVGFGEVGQCIAGDLHLVVMGNNVLIVAVVHAEAAGNNAKLGEAEFFI